MDDTGGGETPGTFFNNQQSSTYHREHSNAYNYVATHDVSETDSAQDRFTGSREDHWYGYPPVSQQVGAHDTQSYSSSSLIPAEPTQSYEEMSQPKLNYGTDASSYQTLSYQTLDEGEPSRHLDHSPLTPNLPMQSSGQSMPPSGPAANLDSTRAATSNPIISLISPRPRPIERSESLLAPNFEAGGTLHQPLHSTSSESCQPSWQDHGTSHALHSPSHFVDTSQSQASGYGSYAPLSASSTASFAFHETPYRQEETAHYQQAPTFNSSIQPLGAAMPYLNSQMYTHGPSQSTASLSERSPLHSPFATNFSQGSGQSLGSSGGPHTHYNPQHHPQASESQLNGYQSSYMQDYHPCANASVSSYHLPLRIAQSQASYDSSGSYYHAYGSSSNASQADPHPSRLYASSQVHNEASQRLEFAAGSRHPPTYTSLQYENPNVAEASWETQTAAIPSQASSLQLLQSQPHHGNLTSLSLQPKPYRHYQTVNAPSYRIRQYPNQHLSLPGILQAVPHPQLSPTWPNSPLVSPALMTHPPGLYISGQPGTDYFPTPGSLPSPIDYFKDRQMLQEQLQFASNPSSPPSGSSAGSQQSGQASDDTRRRASLVDQGTSGMTDSSMLYAKEGRAASRASAANKAKAGKGPDTSQPHTKKETRVVTGTCETCRKVFATINIRGQPEDFNNEFDLVYYCLDCAPAILGVSRSELEASLGLDSGVSEENAAIDQEGTLAAGSTTAATTPARAEPVKLAPRGARKRIRATDVSSPTICDVCSRWVAHGSPVAREVGAELAFNVEIVCAHCCDKYRRCSDCGGGGGARLGVGKWRCKELFSPGRKTCDMSHARQSSIQTMEYFITRISDIPDEEMPELLNKCQVVFRNALLNGLAVPEVLERGAAMAGTYADVMSKIVDGWKEARKVIEEDVEESDRYRRYIGLRWSAKVTRKVVSRKRGGRTSVVTDAHVGMTETPPEPCSTKVLRPNMHLSGYVSGEWDIYGGTIYITVSVPYSTGEQYEGSAHIISLLQRRIVQERQEMVDALVQQGRHAEALAIPVVLHAFTMLFYSPDSKLMAYMESKRAMIPLQRYMDKYKDTDPSVFPPYRKAYIAPSQKPEEWTVLVRRILYPSQLPTPSSSRGVAVSESSSSNHQFSHADESLYHFDQNHE